MAIDIKFDSLQYKPILLSAILKSILNSSSNLSGFECLDDPVFFKESDQLIFLKNSKSIFIKQFNEEIVKSTRIMLFYTHEHLLSRKYNDFIIAELEIIENEFLEIMLMLDSISFSKNKIYVIEQCVFILHKIGKLGGARAILNNNAIQLMISLKFFVKYLELA